MQRATRPSAGATSYVSRSLKHGLKCCTHMQTHTDEHTQTSVAHVRPSCLEGGRAELHHPLEIHLSQTEKPLAQGSPYLHPSCLYSSCLHLSLPAPFPCPPRGSTICCHNWSPLPLTMLEIPPTLVVFTFSIAQTFFSISLPPPPTLPLLQLPFSFVVAFYLLFIHLLLCCSCLPHRPSLLLIQKCYILLAACEIFGNYSGRIFCCCFVFRGFPLEIKLRTVLYFVYTHFIFCFII